MRVNMDNCITQGKAVSPEMIRPFTESDDLLGNTAALTARLKEDGRSVSPTATWGRSTAISWISVFSASRQLRKRQDAAVVARPWWRSRSRYPPATSGTSPCIRDIRSSTVDGLQSTQSVRPGASQTIRRSVVGARGGAAGTAPNPEIRRLVAVASGRLSTAPGPSPTV